MGLTQGEAKLFLNVCQKCCSCGCQGLAVTMENVCNYTVYTHIWRDVGMCVCACDTCCK